MYSEHKVRLGNDPRNRIILLDPRNHKSKANEKLGAIGRKKIEKFKLKNSMQ